VDRSNAAFDDARRAYFAIVGNPKTGTLGYLGDVGTNPSSILDLVRDPGVPGWSGPYLSGVSVENDTVLDSFGSPLEYFYQGSASAVTDLMAIISRGPDRGSTNVSLTPNRWDTYSGTPLPSSAAYPTAGANADNLVFPRFTDNVGLLSYQNSGRINVNLQSYDFDTNVGGYTAPCPNLYSVRVTSATRASDTFAVPFGSAGASFDLIQGVYRVQVYSATSGGVFWDQALAVAAGTSQDHTVSAPGVNSSQTAFYSLLVPQTTGGILTITTSTSATIANNSTGGPYLVRGCSQVRIRNAGGSQVDAFIMPVNLSPYTRRISTTLLNHTVTNSTGANRHLLVYINDIFVGQVGGLGNRKSKTFTNLKPGEVMTIRDQDGNLEATVTLPGSGSTNL
jgi:hypothetical protein